MISNSRRSPRSRRWLTSAILSVAALNLAAGPALATGESGTAVLTGSETINAVGEGLPLCLQVSDDSFYTLDTEDGVDGTATANNSATRYTGPLTVVLDPVEPYYINPAGVFSDSNCLNPGVPATITVTSPGGEVTSCGSNNATYVRANTAVSYSGFGDCTVNGAQAGSDTLHTFEGDLLPCLGDDVTCGDSQIQGVYTET